MNDFIELTQGELALRWRMNPGTLAVWRCQGRGPIYNKRGGKISYSLSDILEYEKLTKINPAENKNNS